MASAPSLLMLMDFFLRHRKCSRFSNFHYKHLQKLIKILSIERKSSQPFSVLTDVHRIYPHFCYGFLIRFSNLLASIHVQNCSKFMKPFAQKRTTEVKKQPSVVSDRAGRKTFCVWADFAFAEKKKFNCVGSF